MNSSLGLIRLAEAAATIDQRAAVILTYHAALEREMDVVLARLLPQPERIRRFGFGHKLDVLAGGMGRNNKIGGHTMTFCSALMSSETPLRTGIARKSLDDLFIRLIGAYRKINRDAGEGLQIDELAAGICGFMADGPLRWELLGISAGLENVLDKLGDFSVGPRGLSRRPPKKPSNVSRSPRSAFLCCPIWISLHKWIVLRLRSGGALKEGGSRIPDRHQDRRGPG